MGNDILKISNLSYRNLPTAYLRTISLTHYTFYQIGSLYHSGIVRIPQQKHMQGKQVKRIVADKTYQQVTQVYAQGIVMQTGIFLCHGKQPEIKFSI